MLEQFWPYFAVLAGSMSGLSAILEKRMLKVQHALAYTTSISAIVAAFSLLLIPFANFSMSLFDVLIIYIYSITLTISYWFTARLFRHGNISIASPIYKTLPILFVALLAFLFLGEYLTPLKYGFIIILVISAYLMINETNKVKESINYRYNYKLLIIFDAFITSIGLIILKYLLQNVDLLSIIIIVNIFTLMNLFAIMFKRGKEYILFLKQDFKTFAPNISLIGVITFLYRIVFYITLNLNLVSLVVPIANITTIIITVLIGGQIFNEKDKLKKLLFALIMLISAYFLIVN
ncbi:MAG: EamA family transporter [Candidatus Micrarchaeia archaeon]